MRKKHVELLFKLDKLQVYLLDGVEKSVAPPAEAKAIVQVGKISHPLALKATGDVRVGAPPAQAASAGVLRRFRTF